ncbi:unnamed protein product [Cuscuta campestris]|uniref:Bifunctional inhibitor/plant lipid transfer protein/seed storage helical domain-containing protein n=1 Tax=Cuscuta campestris TaxID=132261 RepID=A0A484LU51_9ASTE|nr:unnamed protein product [Cuscuta campestris]
MGSYMILLLLVALSAGGGTAAETSDDCTTVIMSMSPCLNYITGNSSSSSPSAGCCVQLSTVVRNNPRCLCQVLAGGSSALGLNINQTQALALPASCNVQTPSVNRCAGVGSPSGSPPGTTSSSRNSSRSGGGSSSSKSTPSGATMTSIKLTRSPLIVAIPLLASYVSTFVG